MAGTKSMTKLRKFNLATLIAIVGLLLPSCAPQEVSLPTMPPFSRVWEATSDYYKICFLPDGYPGRCENGETYAHPIYGAYVLGDYIKQYRQSPTNELREAIIVVADASIRRMDNFHDALVFWYPGDLAVSRAKQEYYSGLTQSYYMLTLFQTYQITEDARYKVASEKVFQSLLIPVEQGGVYYLWEDGVSIEEIPMQPNAFILNGWLTILVNLQRYAQLTGSAEAQKLFDENVQSLARVLPLYDAPEYFNSRYGLTGFQYLKLYFSPTATGVVVQELKLEIPQEGVFKIPVKNGESRWDYYVFEKDIQILPEGLSLLNRSMRMNLVLSRLSFPQENNLHVTLDSTRELQMDVYLYAGIYDPLSTAQVQEEWQLVTTVQVEEGINSFTIPIPWELADLSAYPTSFNKQFDGKNFNIYHFVHIDQLRILYEITGDDIFRTYADRWEGYTLEWPDVEIYQQVETGRYKVPED